MKDQVRAILQKFDELDRQMAALPAGDAAQLAALSRERKKLEPVAAAAREWLRVAGELEGAQALIDSGDAAMADLARTERAALEPLLPPLETAVIRYLNPPDPRADRDTIIEIRPAAGGDEAGLFAGELFRMYSRFAALKGLEVTVYSSNVSGLGGLKEVTFGVSGGNAYGWFRFEQGVHRVQRVPQTEAQGRIHTSTVTVAVLPEATEVEIKVDMKDLKIDTYRASGAGGQHVNKTESAIRITHLPTGIVVACQEERSQGQNRLRAMGLLRARLQEEADNRARREQADERRRQIGTGDRAEKIRTYNFPQDRITDHRINFSVYGIEKFLGGDMDEMVGELIRREEELRKAEKEGA